MAGEPEAAARSGAAMSALRAAALVAAVVLCGCADQKNASAAPAEPQAAPAPPTEPDAEIPAVSGAAAKVDGERAMRYVREQVALGERWPGSPGHKKLHEYLRAQLKRDGLEEDAFEAATPQGKIPMRNFIAKFPGKKEGVIVLASHFDTRPDIPKYVGANDGGSSTALLLEIANHLRSKPRDSHAVWLVFLDGEEAMGKSDDPSLFGSKHLAAKWKQDGTAAQVRAFILLDMVGDKELSIVRDGNSTRWLTQVVKQAADNLALGSYFFRLGTSVIDDHLPFKEVGIPVIDLIDFQYGYDNVFWHTPEDTPDKLSAKSLAIVGNVVLETVRLLDAGAGPKKDARR
jgi:glutaminyl-peptide cyclotransferase